MKILILLTIFIFSNISILLSQTAEGGGVYILNNGRLINSIVTSNYASDGFGVSGSAGTIYNCNVLKNKYLNKQLSHPGDMVMNDGSFITPVIQGGIIQFPTGYTATSVSAVVFYTNSNNDYLGTLLWVVSLSEGKANWQPNYSANNPVIAGLNLFSDPETALLDKEGKNNTDKIIAQLFTNPKTNTSCAATFCKSLGTDWYLPALGQLKELYNNYTTINNVITALNNSNGSNTNYPLLTDSNYWSSTSGNYNGGSWYINLKTYLVGSIQSDGNSFKVRPIKNILSGN